MGTFVKTEGYKVFARVAAGDEWAHVESIPNDQARDEFVSELEDDDEKRAEYVADALI